MSAETTARQEGGVVYVVSSDSQAPLSIRSSAESAGFSVSLLPSLDDVLDTRAGGDLYCVVAPLSALMDCASSNGRSHDVSALDVTIITSARSVLRLRSALKTGAIAILPAASDSENLSAALQRAMELEQEERMVERQRLRILNRIARLSQRERLVMDLIYNGITNKAVANRLDVSVRTVEKLRHDILDAVGAKSVIDLVRTLAQIQYEPAAAIGELEV